jgi:hypothetical protein
MKTSIAVMLLAVGMLLRPQPAPVINSGMAPDNTVVVAAAQQTTPQVLNNVEMKNAVGAGLTGCFQTKAQNGDVYVTCCLDLWIFAICVGVNWSALERILPFL